ncbi:hypothetical protein AX16_000886 [Volvariella volvacea WC 439]|nr:hypothetical protein AX16_000886 [Volvariella volvacea WC 439]
MSRVSIWLRAIFFSILVAFVRSQSDINGDGLEDDPYLQFRPAFARSLPVQILVTGVVLTLVAVLFIHLVFTAQYHWPLAPVNYVLQLSGVTTLLISLIATIHVVLSAASAESESWPYMLSYIAVNVPPLLDSESADDNTWTVAERATWLVMNASTSGLIQITHIQFLTLLYPSKLEKRLIFALLGPMAVVAAIMQLLPIQGSNAVIEIASAVRNVCNATLSLLFTVALFIWGFLVNRKQAWRTDGGTAAFGCAALTLAVVSTALNFLYVPREEEYVWLPGLMWAVILWQSFLGWWWWVGAGSGSGLSNEVDVEEKMRREAKRETKKRAAREKRMERQKKARKVWRDVAEALYHRDGDAQREQRTTREHSDDNVMSGDDPDVGSPHSRRERERTPPSSPDAPHTRHTHPHAASAASISTVGTLSTLPSFLPDAVHRWYHSLRRAHAAAARQQAVERVERIRELNRPDITDVPSSGWGLGSFGWRLSREDRLLHARQRYLRQQQYQQRQAQIGSPNSVDRQSFHENGNGVPEADVHSQQQQQYDQEGWRRRRREQHGNGIGSDDETIVSDDGARPRGRSPTSRRRGERAGTDVEQAVTDDDRIEDDIVAQEKEASSDAERYRQRHDQPPQSRPRRQQRQQQQQQDQARPRSVWWWGPLSRWRLQDSTTY